tara:strand:- start:860 stop:1327 length:468 start_codon:yes stop_codon:yes gene_type:complete
MFEKNKNKSEVKESNMDVFRPSKGSSKVIIGHGVTLKGEITKADEAQVDGVADVTIKTDNLVVGATGKISGNIDTHNADIWGEANGEIKVSGTLTIQEAGLVAGTIEYQNLQIKLGGKINGDIKVSDKIKNISDTPSKKEDSASSKSLQDSISNK